MTERRYMQRVPDSRLITEIVSEKPSAASIVNVSNAGLFTVKKSYSGKVGPRLVQLEIPVPEASESIWALGEVVFEKLGMSCLGSGIRFVSMANFHQRLIRDLVEQRKKDFFDVWKKELRSYKDLTVFPLSCREFGNVSEDTQKMFVLKKY